MESRSQFFNKDRQYRLLLVLGQLWESYHPSRLQLEGNRLTWCWLGDRFKPHSRRTFIVRSFLQSPCRLCYTSCLRGWPYSLRIVVRHWRGHGVWCVDDRWRRSRGRCLFRSFWLSFYRWCRAVIILRRRVLFRIRCRCSWCTSRRWDYDNRYSFCYTFSSLVGVGPWWSLLKANALTFEKSWRDMIFLIICFKWLTN